MPTRAYSRLLAAIALSALWLGYVPRAVLIVPSAAAHVLHDIRPEVRGLMLAVYPQGASLPLPLPRIAAFGAEREAHSDLPFVALLHAGHERDAALQQAVEWLEAEVAADVTPIVVAPRSDRRRAGEAATIRQRYGWRSILLENNQSAVDLVARLPTAEGGGILVLLGDQTPHVVRTIRRTPRVTGAVIVAEVGLAAQAERLARLGVGSDAALTLDLRSAVQSAWNRDRTASQILQITTRFTRY